MTFPNAHNILGMIENDRWGVLGVPGTAHPDVSLPAVPHSRVYYVDGGSTGPTNDLSDGMTPETPKRTLQAAIDLCVSGQDDVVVVLNYGGNARAVEAWPVEVNKDMIHIIGVGSPSQKWPTVSVLAPAAADTARPALLITGQRCEIAGLELGGGNTAACVYLGTAGLISPWGVWIHDCWFGVADGVGQDGVGILAGADAPYARIENCTFGQAITRDGIRIAGNSTRGMIVGNLFKVMPGVAINISGAAVAVEIRNNVMFLPSNTAGKGITTSAASAGCLIHNNAANFGETDMAANPYTEGAGAGVNSWLYNLKAITPIMPA